MPPIPILPDVNSYPGSSSLSHWMSYLMRFFPGWPEFEAPGSYCLSISLLFLLAFAAEFCSLMMSSIKKQEMGLKSLLYDAGLHALRVFMAYLIIISIIATDFSFFLAAVFGHAAGHLASELYQCYLDQEMNRHLPGTLSDGLVTKVSVWSDN